MDRVNRLVLVSIFPLHVNIHDLEQQSSVHYTDNGTHMVPCMMYLYIFERPKIGLKYSLLMFVRGHLSPFLTVVIKILFIYLLFYQVS
jgi:hypothetical protein